jgi:phosphoglycerate kinase
LSIVTIKDIDVTGKRVLVRVDFNVPLNPINNSIMDDSRIRATFPTIKYLVEHGAKTILCSHMGRPKGKVVENLKMAPVAQRLADLIALPVKTAPDCIGPEVVNKIKELKNGEILVLENLRFHPEEEANDPNFAKSLAELADIYVNDAFGAAHRAHASTVGITKFLPSYCGLLMQKELNSLGKLLTAPDHPFAALLGGAKVSDKVGVIRNILDKIDILLTGGSMAANFLSARGYNVGLSRIETDKQDLVKELIKLCSSNNKDLILPIDAVVSRDLKQPVQLKTSKIDKIPDDVYIVDIGPETISVFTQQLKSCKTVFWNGPMGIYEIPEFANGTKKLVEIVANLDATTIIGGGSTAEIVEEMKLTDKMTHVSTGGGASLEFLEGKTLPGVEALLNK